MHERWGEASWQEEIPAAAPAAAASRSSGASWSPGYWSAGLWVATSVKQTWSEKSDGNKEPFETEGKEMIWFFWVSMFLSAYALQNIFYSVRNYCRRRRINHVFGRERPVLDVGVQVDLLPNPAVPQPPPPPPAVQQRRPVQPENVYIAPAAGTKVHRLGNCCGLAGALNVREYQLCQFCYP